MKSVLLFLFKLPFRILALPIVILLFGLVYCIIDI